jgi:hypothetical protein
MGKYQHGGFRPIDQNIYPISSFLDTQSSDTHSPSNVPSISHFRGVSSGAAGHFLDEDFRSGNTVNSSCTRLHRARARSETGTWYDALRHGHSGGQCSRPRTTKCEPLRFAWFAASKCIVIEGRRTGVKYVLLVASKARRPKRASSYQFCADYIHSKRRLSPKTRRL